MNPRGFLAKRKVHLIFAGALILALAFNITIDLAAGQPFLGATGKAISEIRPMEYLMVAIFWYASAVYHPTDGWYSPLITLKLSESNNQK